MVADSPYVGAFHEFEVKHMAGGGTLGRGHLSGSILKGDSRWFPKNFTHF
jgi:hypothetical protein